MSAPQLPPCQCLFVGGLEGSGNQLVAKKLADWFGWSTFDASRYPSNVCREGLARRKFTTEGTHWVRHVFPSLVSSVQVDLCSDPPTPHIVYGPFLRRTLRARIVDLGRKPGVPGSSIWIIMLDVSTERAWHRLCSGGSPISRTIFDQNAALYQSPLVDDACVEGNVLVLDGNNDKVGILANKAWRTIPGLRDLRIT